MTSVQLEQIVREWQDRLNIPHWRVIIDWDKSPRDDAYADITREGDSYEGAKLRLDSQYLDWSLRLTNEVIVHELLHMLFDDLQTAAESAEEVMPLSAYKLFDQRITHELEGVVDRTARLLVKFAGVFDPDPAREETTYVFS